MCLLDTNVSCAKTAEPVGMSFQMWTRVVPRNHAFSGVQTPPREGAIELGTCEKYLTIGNIWSEPRLFSRWQQ